MRILHVTPSFYPAWAYGGVPRCAYELCRALVRSGQQVTVWTTDVFDATRRTAQREATVDGIEIRYFPNLSNRLAYHLQVYLPRGLRREAHAHVRDFDLVHLHSHRHVMNPPVVAAARHAGVPYVCTGHGTVALIERQLLAKRVVDAWGARAILQRAAACIAVAQSEVHHYRASGVDAARVQVIPNGLRLDEYARLPARGDFRRSQHLGDAPLVLFLGKITPRKGLDVLVRALAQLPPDVQLVVAGNFMMPAGPIHRLADEIGAAHRIHYVGLLEGEAKLAAYVDADVVAYPAAHEIFGLVPFEALMCGTPVVVCDDSGCGEVVRAANGGLLVPYGDAPALAAALQRLLSDEAQRRACVASGRRYVEQHLDWDRIAQSTLALYRDVLARTPRTAPVAVEVAGHGGRTR